MKRFLCVFLCFFLLAGSALAQTTQKEKSTGTPPKTDDDATGQLVYDSADEAGVVVNVPEPGDLSAEESAAFAVNPLDVVLVLDCSGTMERANHRNGKILLSYAQDAAVMFCDTLFSLNPNSRVSVVQYETTASVVSGFVGASSQNALETQIRGIRLGNRTNTGGGYALANRLLDEGRREGVNRVVLMLSDGQANEGAADPLAYAVGQGMSAAERGRVYTIGLVGGLNESEKRYTRAALNAGYETQYYEVDFDQVADVSAQLASVFVTIATSGGASEDTISYRMYVDGGMDVRVENASGDYLSGAPEDYRERSSFGVIATLGDNMDQKLVVLRDGDYNVRLHGYTTGAGMFTLSQIRGSVGAETRMLGQYVDTHPALCYIITIKDGLATIQNASYEPLDPDALDPFTGARTQGLHMPAAGVTVRECSLRAAPDPQAKQIDELNINTITEVFAVDPETGWYFVGVVDERIYRGWVRGKDLTVTGYVPNMIWLEGQYTIATDAQSRYAPLDIALEATPISAGATLALKHAERDIDNNEWVYVETTISNRKAYVYLPASCLESWTPRTADGFRMGYAAASCMWRKVTDGNGFTEIMWAAPHAAGGVVLSGRSSSKRGAINATQGDRDSFVIKLAPDGAFERVVTSGGSGWDSYHCIVPTDGGYLVSGVSRSNNGDFADIWNPISHTNKASATTKYTNALIGMLDEAFDIRWMQSFGVGTTSYGFDMVLELADGTIAGVGWMKKSEHGVLAGNGMQDFYVVKMTRGGNVIAMRNYGGGYDEVPDSGVATPDGGLIMVGSRGGSDLDGYILVLDANLNMVSECTYGGKGEDTFDNVRLLPDGTFLVTGFTNSPSGNGVGDSKGGYDFWAMNIDSLGKPIWVRRYGGSGDEILCGTTVLEDGSCLLVGSTTSIDGDARAAKRASTKPDAWVLCINEFGRPLWQYGCGGGGEDYFNTAAVDPADGGIVLAGTYNYKSTTDARGYIVKIMPPAYMNTRERVF